jgi:uncharacterized oxidoreductase
MPDLSQPALVEGIQRIFVAAGVQSEEALTVAEHLVEAEACGVSSHGVMRVGQYLEGIRARTIAVDAIMRVVQRTASTAVLDGGGGLGIVMAGKAMEMAISLARASGCGVASMRHCGHSGRLGSYTSHAARHGMVGMMLVNGGGKGQWMGPHGGRSGRLATNPLSIAAPASAAGQLMIDLATSTAPEGKVRSEMLAGRAVPAGWVVDAEGCSSTDPAALYGPPQGALLPFGGHKGFALAMAVDALAGGLSGAGCCTEPPDALKPGGDGILAIAIDVAAFRPLAEFADEITGLMEHVRSCPAIPGQQVQVPGDPERTRRERSQAQGIPIHDALWASLQEAARTVGVSWNSPVPDDDLRYPLGGSTACHV